VAAAVSWPACTPRCWQGTDPWRLVRTGHGIRVVLLLQAKAVHGLSTNVIISIGGYVNHVLERCETAMFTAEPGGVSNAQVQV
jgi:hypothetical protein